MFVDEAQWLQQALARLNLPRGSRLLDIGSSTLEFRTVVQPHIERHVFAPLRAQGVAVSHLDAREAPGVDIVSDITTLEGVRAEGFDAAICTSLLEHVVNRENTVHNICRVIAPGGVLLLTVPLRYPLHFDPIDTGFRPTPEELSALVPWPEVIERSVLTIRDPLHYKGKRLPRRFIAPWRVACLVVRKPTS